MTIRTTATATLAQDAELRFGQSGKAVCRLRVASNERKYNRDTSAWEDGDATFIDVTVFGAKAEACAELTKGTLLLIDGKLRSRDWEDKQGQKRTSYEIIADEVGTIVKATASGGQGAGWHQPMPPQTRKPPAGDPWADQQPAIDTWAAQDQGQQAAQYNQPPF